MADRRFYELVVYVPGFDYVARIQTNLFVELPANPDKYSIGQALLAWGALTPDVREAILGGGGSTRRRR